MKVMLRAMLVLKPRPDKKRSTLSAIIAETTNLPITQSWNLFLDFVFPGRLSEEPYLMDRSLLKSHAHSSQSFWWEYIENHHFYVIF